jgi:ComF family protein
VAVRGFFPFLVDMLVPPLCVHCGAEIGNETSPECASVPEGLSPAIFSFLAPGPVTLCLDCWLGLEPARHPSLLSTGAGAHTTIRLVTPFFTNEVLLSVVRFLKFEGGIPAADPLSWWMAYALDRLGCPPAARALVIPVPLHRRRRRRRGYNQAAILARSIATRLELPCDERTLVRRRHTRSQARLAEGERDENVRDAFGLREMRTIRGRHIVLVDDLVTSGSTARSSVTSMLRAAPASITVLAAGRRKAVSYK